MSPSLRRLLLSRSFWLVALLILLTTSFAMGLGAGIRGGITWLLTPIAVAGSLAGYGLSRSRMKGWQGGCFLVGVGTAGIIFDFAHLAEPLVVFIKTLVVLRMQIIGWVRERVIPPDLTPVIHPILDSIQRTTVILTRTWIWLLGLRLGTGTVDPVARAFVWSLAVFLCSAWAGWMLGRHRNPLAAFTPSIVVLAVVADYTYTGYFSLWLMLGGVLLLMGLSHYDKDRIRWQRSGVDYSESIPIDTGSAIVIISLALAAMAWMMPSISVKALVKTAQNWGKSQDELAESFGLEPLPPTPSEFASYITPQELPRRHLIGSGPELNNLVVMTIRTGELPTLPQDSNLSVPHRHYWRSLTYDRYTGSGWVSNPVEEISYKANTPVVEVNPQGYRIIQQEVKLFEDTGGQLYWTGNLVTVNQPAEVAWRSRPTDTIQYDPFKGSDLLGVISPVTSYVATSLEANMTGDALRSSTGPYPVWAARYLSLPETVPERVLSLARNITANAAAPYDRAQAIETYLRSNYPYTLDVPAPPIERDVADYFLFDLKKGYCDYYATAMVVLARAAGLPARFVSGYSSGSYDFANAQYVVTEANAHSWVEIFFSGVGWVEFEPTAGLPAIERPGQSSHQTIPFETKTWVSVTDFNDLLKQTSSGIALGLMGIVLLFFISLWVETLWLTIQPAPIRILKIYQRMVRQGNQVAGQMAGETPDEFSTRLMAKLNDMFQTRQPPAFIRSALGEIRLITETYVISTFSRQVIPGKSLGKVIHTWRKLRVRLWVVELFKIFS